MYWILMLGFFPKTFYLFRMWIHGVSDKTSYSIQISFSALERKISMRVNKEELVQKGILLPDSPTSPIAEGKYSSYPSLWMFTSVFCSARISQSITVVLSLTKLIVNCIPIYSFALQMLDQFMLRVLGMILILKDVFLMICF